MEVSEVESRIKAALPDAEIRVNGRDCDFSVTVIWNGFGSLTRIKRHQKVLSCFTDELGNGAIHALSVKAFTRDEWDANQQNTLTQLTAN